MAFGTGVLGLLKINTGTDASPTYTVVGGQRTAKLTPSLKLADITNKGDAGWENSIPTIRALHIEVDGIVDESDAGYLALEQMFWSPPALGKKFQFVYPSGRTVSGTFNMDGIPQGFPYLEAVDYKVTLKSKGACTLA